VLALHKARGAWLRKSPVTRHCLRSAPRCCKTNRAESVLMDIQLAEGLVVLQQHPSVPWAARYSGFVLFLNRGTHLPETVGRVILDQGAFSGVNLLLPYTSPCPNLERYCLSPSQTHTEIAMLGRSFHIAGLLWQPIPLSEQPNMGNRFAHRAPSSKICAPNFRIFCEPLESQQLSELSNQ